MCIGTIDLHTWRIRTLKYLKVMFQIQLTFVERIEFHLEVCEHKEKAFSLMDE